MGATNWLSNISVRAKLALLTGLLAGGIALVAVLSLWALRGATGTSQALVQDDMPVLNALADTRAGVGNLRRFEKDLFLNLGDEAELTRYLGSWRKELGSNDKRLETLLPRLGTDERAQAERMRSAFADYGRAVEAIVADIKIGKINDPWAANKAMEPSKGAIRAADKAFEALSTSVTERTARRVADLGRAEQMATLWIVGTALGSVVLALGLAWVVARRITEPLQRAVAAVERVARGDLSMPIEARGRDETARLLGGLQTMQASLARVVGELHHGIESVAGASTEIARGNADLSARTERQASSLQQTAASMEQLTGAVRSSSDNAVSAQQRAQQATTAAERGGDVVGQVVATMGDIQLASRRIAEITGVIDGIAFQTNILALNAAVEAARAGEQGRGFAVVASEVRALAQRSAEAARQIKGLIGDSVARVEAGSGLVAEAGRTIERAVEEVREVNALIGQIALAAAQQGQGISEVGQAVGTLDQVTQQNAALVEQTAAASESLREQARRLAESVAMFRVAQAAPGTTH